ncbi:branched-chain amino acid ABC transporter substrate-binding protein [Frankia sp. CcI49]|uniref:ABC transporter substrate-binding protein n=1 Tax=Frankia sp. CcI49 TaxID=1745382 RepID=UPI0009762FEF|nr:ABC transporter substrate-binding protein [Frankia sp. CcI49]ONH58851.1 branched-chain amino acid ABC transporter substrate-binding protein [Frankia sp. CcI49]
MRRSRTGLVIASVLLLSIAACGGGDDSTATTAIDQKMFDPGPATGWDNTGLSVDPASLKCADPGGPQARGVTDTEIRVGGLLSMTSPAGVALAAAEAGAKVRFDRANAEGGVNGRKINYVGTLDDGSDPARNVSQAKALVNENVFAAVPTMVRSPNYRDTFCNDGVPYFGWGTQEAYCDTAIGFGITGCLVPSSGHSTSSAWGMVGRSILGDKATGGSVAAIGTDQDNARLGLASITRSFTQSGMKVVYDKSPVPAAGLADATPIIGDVMSADGGAPPDLVVLTTDFGPTAKIAEALAAAGYQGAVLSAVGYDPRLEGYAGLQGTYTLLQWSSTQTDSPAMKQLEADFAKYAPDQAVGLVAMAGYWSADFFLDAVAKTGKDLTVDNLLKTINGGGYTFHRDGALAETQWPLNHTISAPCASTVRLQDKKYVETLKLSCGAPLPSS